MADRYGNVRVKGYQAVKGAAASRTGKKEVLF
jgi:hypothetical protein